MLCYFCGEDKGAALGLKDDAEVPHRAVWDYEPCDECAKLMKAGIMLISVRDGETDGINPHRTGKVCVLREETIRFMVQEPLLTEVLRRRCAFVPDAEWAALGLSNGEVNV
jgi:hypothetical protein